MGHIVGNSCDALAYVATNPGVCFLMSQNWLIDDAEDRMRREVDELWCPSLRMNDKPLPAVYC